MGCLYLAQHPGSAIAAVYESAQGRVPGGEAQHYLKARGCQQRYVLVRPTAHTAHVARLLYSIGSV